MELNVLVEAKKEYMAQLCKLMSQSMIQAFHDMYKEAEKMSKGKKVLLQYQKLLKEVPNWNDHIVKTNVDATCNSCGWFSDLLAAVFVSYVKILSSVRLKSESKKISVKLPTNALFIHTCYINAAKDLYKDPYIYHDEQSEFERDGKLFLRFTIAIEMTIQELLPVEQILKTYMSQAGTQVDLDGEDAGLADAEDPEIEDPDLVPEPVEPEPEPVSATEPVEPVEPVVEEPGSGPEEIKQIPVTGQGLDENLFDDAPESQTKTSPIINNGH
jgi:hypothetical protein